MSKLNTLFAQAAAVATTAMAAPMAFAGEYSEAVSSGVDKTELTAIGVIVLSVAGIILLIRSGKKSAN
ncbi:hypothetical protein [Xanthomonas hortorum]|uniref:Methyltransferase n=2 Tax=Xanthomonas hortorum TaxID=56454 RepID=A0A9X4BUS4_9XANT|nr:hypothetical protein [Xanthomonas hortorum]MDC8639993.1 hypothetical protein [Xanthomonas hortorum pv. hederae]